MTPKTMRVLRHGEKPPAGEPRRFPDRDGYIRLRWKVGLAAYIEVLEHRLVAGAAPGQHVHHLNGNKADNRPENLQILTAVEHGHRHGERSWSLEEAAELYGQGYGTLELGERYGVNPVTVFRALRAAGVRIRSSGELSDRHRQRLAAALRRSYQDPARRARQSDVVRRGWETRRRNAA